MASGTHVASKGVGTSYGGVATLPDLSPRPRLGLTGLLWPNGAPTAALMRTLASLLNLGAGAVRAARGRRSTLGRHMPWRDHEPATHVMAAGTALERRLSHQLIAAGPSVRTLRRGATLVKQGAAGDELFLLLEGSLAVEVDGHRVGEVGPGAILGELAVLEHDLVVVGVVPARLRDRADLVAMAAMLGANPYQVAARLDHWRFGPTVALTVAKVPVEQFRRIRPRLGIVEEGLSLERRPGRPGRRRATLRALTSCRVAVVPDGVLDREALAALAERRRFMPSPAAGPAGAQARMVAG
jgi:CRP-like cAMP-binding protein